MAQDDVLAAFCLSWAVSLVGRRALVFYSSSETARSRARAPSAQPPDDDAPADDGCPVHAGMKRVNIESVGVEPSLGSEDVAHAAVKLNHGPRAQNRKRSRPAESATSATHEGIPEQNTDERSSGVMVSSRAVAEDVDASTLSGGDVLRLPLHTPEGRWFTGRVTAVRTSAHNGHGDSADMIAGQRNSPTAMAASAGVWMRVQYDVDGSVEWLPAARGAASVPIALARSAHSMRPCECAAGCTCASDCKCARVCVCPSPPGVALDLHVPARPGLDAPQSGVASASCTSATAFMSALPSTCIPLLVGVSSPDGPSRNAPHKKRRAALAQSSEAVLAVESARLRRCLVEDDREMKESALLRGIATAAASGHVLERHPADDMDPVRSARDPSLTDDATVHHIRSREKGGSIDDEDHIRPREPAAWRAHARVAPCPGIAIEIDAATGHGSRTISDLAHDAVNSVASNLVGSWLCGWGTDCLAPDAARCLSVQPACWTLALIESVTELIDSARVVTMPILVTALQRAAITAVASSSTVDAARYREAVRNNRYALAANVERSHVPWIAWVARYSRRSGRHLLVFDTPAVCRWRWAAAAGEGPCHSLVADIDAAMATLGGNVVHVAWVDLSECGACTLPLPRVWETATTSNTLVLATEGVAAPHPHCRVCLRVSDELATVCSKGAACPVRSSVTHAACMDPPRWSPGELPASAADERVMIPHSATTAWYAPEVKATMAHPAGSTSSWVCWSCRACDSCGVRHTDHLGRLAGFAAFAAGIEERGGKASTSDSEWAVHSYVPVPGTLVYNSRRAALLQVRDESERTGKPLPSDTTTLLLCDKCAGRMSTGQYCPVCHCKYEDDTMHMLVCDACTCWVHADCDGLTPADLAAVELRRHSHWSKDYMCPLCRHRTMATIVEQLRIEDRLGFFTLPVTEAVAPGYATVIKHPMDFWTLSANLDTGLYDQPSGRGIDLFRTHAELIAKNALVFNTPQDRVYREAAKLLKAVESVFAARLPAASALSALPDVSTIPFSGASPSGDLIGSAQTVSTSRADSADGAAQRAARSTATQADGSQAPALNKRIRGGASWNAGDDAARRLAAMNAVAGNSRAASAVANAGARAAAALNKQQQPEEFLPLVEIASLDDDVTASATEVWIEPAAADAMSRCDACSSCAQTAYASTFLRCVDCCATVHPPCCARAADAWDASLAAADMLLGMSVVGPPSLAAAYAVRPSRAQITNALALAYRLRGDQGLQWRPMLERYQGSEALFDRLLNSSTLRAVVSLQFGDTWRCDSCRVCEACGDAVPKSGAFTVACSRCASTYHWYCCTPAITAVEAGDWFCSRCVDCEDPTCTTTRCSRAETCAWSCQLDRCMSCAQKGGARPPLRMLPSLLHVLGSGKQRDADDGVCPVCHTAWLASDDTLVCCDSCNRWVHGACDPMFIGAATRSVLSRFDDSAEYFCATCRNDSTSLALRAARACAQRCTAVRACLRAGRLARMTAASCAATWRSRARASAASHRGSLPWLLQYHSSLRSVALRRRLQLSLMGDSVPPLGPQLRVALRQSAPHPSQMLLGHLVANKLLQHVAAGVAGAATRSLPKGTPRVDAQDGIGLHSDDTAGTPEPDGDLRTLVPDPRRCVLCGLRGGFDEGVAAIEALLDTDGGAPLLASVRALSMAGHPTNALATASSKRQAEVAAAANHRRTQLLSQCEQHAAALLSTCCPPTPVGIEGRLLVLDAPVSTSPVPVAGVSDAVDTSAHSATACCVHAMCAVWSSEVFESSDGTLHHVDRALRRAHRTSCAFCQRTGATLGCCRRTCHTVYHLRCAVLAGALFTPSKEVWCPEHVTDATWALAEQRARDASCCELAAALQQASGSPSRTAHLIIAIAGLRKYLGTVLRPWSAARTSLHVGGPAALRSWAGPKPCRTLAAMGITVGRAPPVDSDLRPHELDAPDSHMHASSTHTALDALVRCGQLSRLLCGTSAALSSSSKGVLQVAGLTVLDWGSVVVDQPGFNTVDLIVPVGFRARRIWWAALRDARARGFEIRVSSYTCEVIRAPTQTSSPAHQHGAPSLHDDAPATAWFVITCDADASLTAAAASPAAAFRALRSQLASRLGVAGSFLLSRTEQQHWSVSQCRWHAANDSPGLHPSATHGKRARLWWRDSDCTARDVQLRAGQHVTKGNLPDHTVIAGVFSSIVSDVTSHARTGAGARTARAVFSAEQWFGLGLAAVQARLEAAPDAVLTMITPAGSTARGWQRHRFSYVLPSQQALADARATRDALSLQQQRSMAGCARFAVFDRNALNRAHRALTFLAARNSSLFAPELVELDRVAMGGSLLAPRVDADAETPDVPDGEEVADVTDDAGAVPFLAASVVTAPGAAATSAGAPLETPDDATSDSRLQDAFLVMRSVPLWERLCVRRSRIHGWGLFVKHDVPAHSVLVEYTGTCVRVGVADRREIGYEESHRTERLAGDALWLHTMHGDDAAVREALFCAHDRLATACTCVSAGVRASASDGSGSCYLFRLDDEWIIDATVEGSAARFMNHSCEPNAYSRPAVVAGARRILICALRPLAAGEEITYNYKFALEEESAKKLPCYCGAPSCWGTMN